MLEITPRCHDENTYVCLIKIHVYMQTEICRNNAFGIVRFSECAEALAYIS